MTASIFRSVYLLIYIVLLGCSTNVLSDVTVSTQQLTIEVGTSAMFQLYITDVFDQVQTVSFESNHEDLVEPIPSSFLVNSSTPATEYNVAVFALAAGHAVVTTAITPANVSTAHAYVHVTNVHSEALNIVSIVIGWLYFISWSISFYPQIYQNWKRQSVVGYSFDYVSLNIIGYVLYSLFNCCLYWIPAIKNEYLERNPTGSIPVLLNDIVFSLHGVAATLFIIGQCVMYERGSQRVSWTTRIIIGVVTIFLFVSMVLAFASVVHWLDFLYLCSYVKLSFTLIKYVPQAYLNYKMKSTEGWSIGNIFLDFIGGMFSMFQMMINAYNQDDWESITGDLTKFGLGLFSVAFDIFFFIQHYVLYRSKPEKVVPEKHPDISILAVHTAPKYPEGEYPGQTLAPRAQGLHGMA